MSARHRVAIAVLAMLTGLPAVTTACAMACTSAPAAVASSHPSCEGMASPSTGERLTAAAPPDCASHDAAVTHVTATAPERAAFRATAVTLAPSGPHGAIAPASTGRSIVRILAPPGAAPPTPPLVLRI